MAIGSLISLLPRLLTCLLIGTLIGAFHGFFIAYVHIPPFITTLAGMLLWRGVATIVLDGRPIAPFPSSRPSSMPPNNCATASWHSIPRRRRLSTRPPAKCIVSRPSRVQKNLNTNSCIHSSILPTMPSYWPRRPTMPS